MLAADVPQATPHKARHEPSQEQARAATSSPWLKRSAVTWYLVAAAGQLAFVYFIVAYYGIRTASGDFAGWDDKPLIEGYVTGDGLGNFMFISHVLLAAVITLGGLHQLIPAIRNRWPISHRIVGRSFVIVAYFMALNGLWLVWGRGTQLSVVSAIPTSLNALLLLWFVSAAWFLAMRGRYADHRRWACAPLSWRTACGSFESASWPGC